MKTLQLYKTKEESQLITLQQDTDKEWFVMTTGNMVSRLMNSTFVVKLCSHRISYVEKSMHINNSQILV